MTAKDVADQAITSRTAISAYENGRKSPTTETLERLLKSTGHKHTIQPVIEFYSEFTPRGRGIPVPNSLPRLPPAKAFASITLPTALAWSGQPRRMDLADRDSRREVYRLVLSEGTSEDILEMVDGLLLIDLWDELLLPRDVKAAWQPLIERELSDDGI